MGIASSLAVYFISWWIILFAVLPWGVTRHDGSVRGADAGAPQVPHLRRKFIVTTVLAALIWLIVFALNRLDVLSFQRLAAGLSLQ